MNRLELQQLATDRLQDAIILLNGGRWSAAYYLVGYAVECALKSCILAHIEATGIIFQEGNKKYSEKCWTHNIEELVKLAGLEQQRQTDIGLNPTLGQNWLTTKDWNENSRYEQKSQPEAEKLCDAINDNSDGVFQWIKSSW